MIYWFGTQYGLHLSCFGLKRENMLNFYPTTLAKIYLTFLPENDFVYLDLCTKIFGLKEPLRNKNQLHFASEARKSLN